ncbi:MAG: hypothetical protein SOH80_06325 [Eubacteriales bacterium]
MRGLEIRDNGCIEVEGDDYTYTYCYPYVNDVKVSAWKVVSVNIGDDYSTTITLTGYAPPAREPEMTFSSDTILTEDINGYVTINGNVTLDLAGHTITGGGNYGTIYVNNGCTLTLKDSSADKTGTITGGGGDTGGGVAVSVNATFNMQGGTITGNSATQGGGVYSSGTFNMSGGTISNNNATGGFEGVGGGVVIQSGNFTMSGTAAITGNSSGDFGNGGGVYFAGTTFTMSGGSITQNSGFYGAGVYMDRGTLNMSGNASISSNTASGCSGGVQVRDYATLNMSGNAAIANNRASYEGGAIYLDGTLTMTDSASITGNSTSDKSAGGICVHSGNLKIGGGVKISGNTRNGSAEDVDLYPGKVITVTAALTEETPITVRRSDSNGQNYGEGVITANNGSSYTVQESDKAKFSPASSGQRVKWVDGQARLINLYRVTYNPNGATSGTVPTDENNPYESGSTVTVLGNTGNLAKTSHNFNGWNTAANGRGTSYAADATFNIERNTTLYAQWEEVPHVHSFTYEADGATITATCTAEGCTLPEVGGKHVATLTIAAPALTTYGGTESAEATIIDANSIQGDAKVQYQKKSGESYGTATEIAPTDAGDYKASITVGGVTASVEYTIAQADPTANAPTGLTATYGQTLADVSLEGKNSEGNTPGTWTWANNTQSVGDVVTPAATFKATFTPNSSNYKTVENVDVSVTVGKADPTAPTGLIATYGQTLADVTLPDGWTWADSTQSVGNVVDPATTFKANFAGNDNYNAASNVDVSVTVGKADQTAPTGLTATKASSNSAADGKISGVTSAMEYQIDGASAWTAVGENKTEITDLAAGTYKVRYAETANENASPEATIQVGVKEDQTAPTGLTATKASSSTAEDGKISNVTDAMEYQKDGDTSWTAVGNGKTEITGLTAGTYKVRYAGTADKNASDVTSVEVGTKTDQTAPTGLTATKASSSTATDGKISGVTATMEYQIDGATTWTAVGENQTEITGLTAGTYKVRYAGTADKNASPVSTVEVGVKVAPTVTAPTANPLTYNGQAQELVIAGSTEDGTLYYAVTAENMAPTDDSLYTTSIPSKTDAGTYYVWYKVVGDANHNNVGPEKVSVSIGKADATITAKDQTIKEGESVAGGTGNVDVSGLVTGHSLDAISLAGGTGETAGKVIASDARIKDGNNQDVTSNYTVSYTPGTLTVRAALSRTVTFKVVNGSWNDETTADKTVTLTGYEGDTLKLAATDIPAVGTKPNDTYKAGSWDVTPSAETEITADTTYTYTYAAKEASVVTKAPTAKTLTYTGSAQALVTAGEATGGTMQYAIGDANGASQPYTTSIPAKTDAGTYYVWYKVKADDTHIDSNPFCVTVKISKKPAEEEEPEKPAEVKTVAMYRLYNPFNREHLYTESENEKNVLSTKYGWKYEGIAWYAPEKSNTPVYRLYNPVLRDHHYTTDKHEKDVLSTKYGWKYEGIGWYSDDNKTVPIYRVFCPFITSGSHHFTAGKNEVKHLISVGWIDEKIGWYGVKEK